MDLESVRPVRRAGPPMLPEVSGGREAYRWTLPGATVLIAFAVVVGLAWVITIGTANDLNALLFRQLTGAAPLDRLLFLGLVGVMMGAMMMPAAIPMLAAYRGLAALDSTIPEARVRTSLFVGAYLFLWTAFTAAALIVLLALGWLSVLSGIALLVPGLLLVAAGLYQFSSWKTYCLSTCRTPVGFILEHWRTGRRGAVRMGFAHGLYCLGCCWVLMLVVFVTGSMSLLWMGGFSALVVAEKLWGRGDVLARLIGGTAISGGIIATAWLVLTASLL